MSSTPLLIRALHGEPIDRPPVWLMRQAGRYMSEYLAIKEKHTFLEMCLSSDLAFEVTMQPIHFLDVDAAIVFSDILLPTRALGFDVDFQPGPVVKNKVRSADDVQRLQLRDVSETLSPVSETISRLRRELDSKRKAVLGFAGAPYTLACYLLDQGPYKHFQGTQVFARSEPTAFSQFMDHLAVLVEQALLAQLDAGAHAVQLFDTWGGNLNREDFMRYSLPWIKKIATSLRARGKDLILYVGNGAHLFEDMLSVESTCIGLDWRADLRAAQKRAPKVALQGNLDPTVLFSPEAEVRKMTREMLSEVERKTGYIANLGHGVLPKTPRENVKAFVEEVKEWRWK